MNSNRNIRWWKSSNSSHRRFIHPGRERYWTEERTVTVRPPPPVSDTGQALTPPTRGGETCPRVNGETFPPPVPLMVGQASSPDIMMTSGDACPTNEWEKG